MPNPWVEFLKAKAKNTGISYGCLLSDKKVIEEYRLKKQGLDTPEIKKAKDSHQIWKDNLKKWDDEQKKITRV